MSRLNSSSLFTKFTVDQLDKFKKLMTQKGFDIKKEDKGFAPAYFSKVFATELSAEWQANKTTAEKFANVQRLYSQA